MSSSALAKMMRGFRQISKRYLLLSISLILFKEADAGDFMLNLEQYFGQGNYDSVIALSQRVLAEDSSRLDALYFEGPACFLSDSCESYITAAINGSSDDKVSQFRKLAVLYYAGRIQEADRVLRRLESVFPQACWCHYWRARLCEESGLDSLAAAEYRLAQADSVCRPLAWLGEARVCRSMGELDWADSLYDRLSLRPIFGPQARLDKEWNRGWRGHWQSALKELERRWAAEPSWFSAFGLGYMLNALERWAESYRLLDRAQKLWPNNKILLELLLEVCDKLQLEQEKALILARFNARQLAYLHNGIWLEDAFEANDTLAVRQRAQSFIRFEPDWAYPVTAYLAWVDKRGGQVEGDSLLSECARQAPSQLVEQMRCVRTGVRSPADALRAADSLALWPRSFDTFSQSRLEWLYREGREADSRAQARKLLAAYPGLFWVRLQMARLEFDAGRWNEVHRWLNGLDSVIAGNLSCRELRLVTFIAEGRRAAAKNLLDSLCRLYPLRPPLVRASWQLFREAEQMDTLKTVIKRVLTVPELSIPILQELVQALLLVQDYSTADSLLTDALKRKPQAAELWYLRGRVRSAGNLDEAAADFRKAQALDPYDEEYGLGVLASTAKGLTLDRVSDRSEPDTTALPTLSVDSILALAGKAGVAPGSAGGVILHAGWQQIYHPGFRKLRRIHRIVKLARPDAVARYGTPLYSFNAWREVPRLIRARTILADGSTIDVRPDQVLIGASADAPATDNRIVSWSYAHADSGAVLEALIQFEGWYQDGTDLFHNDILNESDPVLICRTELRVPSSWGVLHNQSYGVKLDSSAAQGYAIYQWSAAALPPLYNEEDGPGLAESSQWVRYADRRSWAEVSGQYWREIAPKVETTSKIRRLSQDLAKNARDEKAKIESIFRFVADRIRYVAVSLGEGAYVPRSAQQTLEQGYGDCKDKSMLLISLLKALGVEAYPALVFSYDSSLFDAGLPHRNQFDHMVVYLPWDSGCFMDPTCGACSPRDWFVDYKGKPTLIVDTGRPQPLARTPQATSADCTLKRTERITALAAGGARANISLELGGNLALVLKSNLAGLDSSDWRDFVEKQTHVGLWESSRFLEGHAAENRNPGARLLCFARYAYDSAFSNNQKYTAVQLTLNPLDLLLTLPDTVQRKLDWVVESPLHYEDSYTVLAGSQWELYGYQAPWVSETKWYRLESRIDETAESVTVAVRFDLKAPRVKREDLGAFEQSIGKARERVQNLGLVYRRRPDSSRVSALAEAIAKNPQDASLKVALAEVYLDTDAGGEGCRGQERRRRAVDLLSRAAKLGPDMETIMLQLGAVLIGERRYREADSIFDAFAGNHATSFLFDALHISAKVQLGKYAEVIPLAEKLLVQSPQNEYRGLLALAYSHLGQWEEARKEIRLLETLRAEPSLIRQAWFGYYLEAGQWDSAETLLEAWPDTSRLATFFSRCALYEKQGRLKDVLEETFKLLSDYPDSPLLLNQTAWMLAQSDCKLDTALVLINRAMALSGVCNCSYRNTRGVVLLKFGKYAQAKQDLLFALNDQSANSQLINRYYLGLCSLKDGNREDAREQFRSALNYDGDSSLIKLVRVALDSLEGQK